MLLQNKKPGNTICLRKSKNVLHKILRTTINEKLQSKLTRLNDCVSCLAVKAYVCCLRENTLRSLIQPFISQAQFSFFYKSSSTISVVQ